MTSLDRPLSYAIAVGAIALALAHAKLLNPAAPIASFVLAVMISTWIGGTLPGLLAMGLSLVAIPPLLFAGVEPGQEGLQLFRIVFFLVICSFIVWIRASQRRATEALTNARDAARRSEKELRDAFESIPAVAWTARADGSNEAINRSWERYTGISRARTEGDGWQAAVHPDDLEQHRARWLAHVAAGQPFENEARYRRASDGQYRWCLVRAVPMRDEGGRILRWYGLNIDIEDRKVAERALRDSAQQLQHLSRRLLEVQEEDRCHFARELHDEFGQLLAAINVHLHAAWSVSNDAPRPGIREAMKLLQRAGEQVRSLALELRPAMLETAGLEATLRWLAAEHEQRTGIEIRFVGGTCDVAPDVATACFRVVQQALTNVVQHARARHVSIEVADAGATLTVAVEDDGDGFDPKDMESAITRGHLGLVGMRERVQIVGGSLRVDSVPERGTRIEMRMPKGAVAPRVDQ